MNSNFISRIIWACPHQFSWPRRDDTGGYYQLCVNCGSKYKYDWKHMRRTAKVEDLPAETRRPHRQPKVSWSPRERRHAHAVPVLYRINGAGEWLSGSSENLSRSGMLFHGESEVEVGARIEVELEMPAELTGEASGKVVCHGIVARVTSDDADAKNPGGFKIACTIEGYDFRKKPNDRAISIDAHRRRANA